MMWSLMFLKMKEFWSDYQSLKPNLKTTSSENSLYRKNPNFYRRAFEY